MAKMLIYAQGGDVLVIRASGSDGYNPYFFGELGVNINSVETIKWNSAKASNDPYVQRRMREAELVFIAGGDQSVYRDYWTHPEIKEIFEYLILEKKVTMGGTSAGAVILCDYPYTPINDGATSAELLSNPFHENAESLFLDAPIEHPFASNLIVDTHFDQRNRLGRLCVFLQRAYIHTGFSKNLTAIGLNEVTAIEIDENQDAIVFGEFPNYQDYVYIIKTNCDTEQAVLFTDNQTVEWSYGNEAIAMKRKTGKINPTGYNNLTNSEGEPDIADFFLGINNGVVAQIPAQIECVFLAASTSQAQESDIKF